MDIALKTLVLIIFVLVPGFLFRRIYFQGTFAKQFDSKSWSHSLFYSALFGIVLNFFAYHLYERFFLPINYNICLKLYNSISKESISDDIARGFNLGSTYKYLSVLYGLAFVSAWAVYIIIRNLKFDRYFEPLRFHNHWHYYFKGEIKDFREFSLPKGKCSVTAADILVKSEKEGNNLYSGLLSYYSFDNNGNLESVTLTQAQIFKNEKKEFKDINSHVFIIPNSIIQNINLRYTFEEEDNTVRDFITVTLFLSLMVYFWFDFPDIFKGYNLISKIFLKILVTFISTFIVSLIEAIYDYLFLDKKILAIPTDTDLKIIARINEQNNKKTKRLKEIKDQFILAFNLGLFFLTIFGVIMYFTY
jgi:hypothetical protein